MAWRTPRAVVLAVAVSLLVAGRAAAQLLPLTGAQLVAASEHVVVAVVEAANSRWSGRLIVTDYELRVEERLAGKASERVTLTLPGGTVGDETHRTSLDVPLAVGGRYLLFLDDSAGRGPSLMPITGGWQGAVREAAGFDELVADVRGFLAGEPFRKGELRQLSAIVASAAATRGLETKVLEIRDPAVPPIVFNPLPDSSPFAPHDQELMAYWNVYQPDLFRTDPGGAWHFGNGVFDMAGFPDDAQLQAELGRTWPAGGFAITMGRSQNGRTVEVDIALNPAYRWTLDEAEATSPGSSFSFRHVVLGALGRAWGLHYALPLDEPAPSPESAVGVHPQFYRLATLFSSDTEAVRATFGDAPLLDGLISAYGVEPAPLFPVFRATRPVPSSVKRGGKTVLATPIKIENTGTEDLVDPEVEVYLVPQRFSLEGGVLLKRFRVRASIPRGTLHHVAPGPVKVPRTVRAGVYYLAFRLRLAGDEYPGNDVGWSPSFVSLTVRK
jgi:hypothetical protein